MQELENIREQQRMTIVKWTQSTYDKYFSI